jgi:putative intracellular protease/amidase
MRLGAIFSKVKNWGVHTVKDGQLITGQNPASSGPAAKLLIETLKTRRRNSQALISHNWAGRVEIVLHKVR